MQTLHLWIGSRKWLHNLHGDFNQQKVHVILQLRVIRQRFKQELKVQDSYFVQLFLFIITLAVSP